MFGHGIVTVELALAASQQTTESKVPLQPGSLSSKITHKLYVIKMLLVAINSSQISTHLLIKIFKTYKEKYGNNFN